MELNPRQQSGCNTWTARYDTSRHTDVNRSGLVWCSLVHFLLVISQGSTENRVPAMFRFLSAAFQPYTNQCNIWRATHRCCMRSIPVNSLAVEGGGVSRLGLGYRRGSCCRGGLGIWVCLLIALLKSWPLDGSALLQPDLGLALQQLVLAGSNIYLHREAAHHQQRVHALSRRYITTMPWKGSRTSSLQWPSTGNAATFAHVWFHAAVAVMRTPQCCRCARLKAAQTSFKTSFTKKMKRQARILHFRATVLLSAADCSTESIVLQPNALPAISVHRTWPSPSFHG